MEKMDQRAFGIGLFNLIMIIQGNPQKRIRERVEAHTYFLELLPILT